MEEPVLQRRYIQTEVDGHTRSLFRDRIQCPLSLPDRDPDPDPVSPIV